MYTELHLHTSFSFLDGASQPDELVRRAVDLGYTALAITDHDGVHGALEFAQLAEEAGIQPITGAEITLADGSHLTLLAETPEGYSNLCRVLTHIHHGRRPAPIPLPEEGQDQRFDQKLNPPLGDYADGLILLTGCRNSQLCRVVDDDNIPAARHLLDQYIAWFGRNNVFVELQQNEVHGDTARIRTLVELATHAGLRYVATS
ncbi:MAG TPA: PHP domain-containing protein, partial [Thermomicrobiales bacterium]|nr:PHP domain-containing protein [Thermomicrobiales bacterium]